MKMTRTFVGLSSAALVLAAAIATVHYAASARETSAPAVRVDSQPVNRAPGSGNGYAPIVKKIAPGVVNIYSSRTTKQRFYADPVSRFFYGNQLPKDDSVLTHRDNWLGSGVIVTPDGYILTANHVVENADEIKVGFSTNKTEYAAKIVGTDPATDIAVLKIDAKDLPALTLGDSSQVEVGDVVLAVGNPFGIGQTVTRGIVSALGRALPDLNDENPERLLHFQDYIQTDASINKGNSGGALVDAEGRLIGINDALVSPSGTSAGIGFAVPINLARNVMEGIINSGRVTRGFLGVGLQDLDAGLAKNFGVANSGGVLITDVGEETPAAKAGLQSGDVIIAVNDREISGSDNFRVTISQLPPGAQAKVKVIRSRAEKVFTATLEENPNFAALPGKPGRNRANRANHPAPEMPMADALDGVQVQDFDGDFRQQLRAPLAVVGAVVTELDSGSNSARAGLRRGDVIVGINQQAVGDAEDAVRLVQAARSEQILVKVWRPGGKNGLTRYFSVNNTRPAK